MNEQVKGLEKSAKWGFSSLPKHLQRGLKKSLEGEVPFLAMPITWLAGKAFGKKKVQEAVFKGFQRPILSADVAMGNLASKAVGKVSGGRGQTLFKDKVILPLGKDTAGKTHRTGGVEAYVPSFTAPAKKVGKFVMPAAGAMYLEDKLLGKKGMEGKNIVKQADLHKAAELLDGLNKENSHLKKEAKATELLYKQAELGQVKMPETFAEYQEKVAELLSKDLDVMEEAIKIASSAENELGGLDSIPSGNSNPRDAFAQAIME